MTPDKNDLDNIPDVKFKIMITSIIKQLKEDSNVFQENTDTQINEIRKLTHNMKIEFNKEIEILWKA